MKDSVVYVVSINGKWGLVKDLNETSEGWSPMDYMTEVDPPSHLFNSTSPSQVPSSQPNHEIESNLGVVQTSLPMNSKAGLGNGLADALLAKKSGDVNLAGSLADALKKRKGATGNDSEEENEDDDDW